MRYAVGLGSNLGDRLSHLRAAVARIRRLGELFAVASLYESAPLGGPEQDPYLNTLVVLECNLQPAGLLTRLQEIEDQEGRVRSVRWGPRTLDLDIVAWEGEALSTAELTIPHPRAAEREFVLRPLVDVWPDVEVAPRLSAAAALKGLADQGVELVADDWV